MTKIGLDLGYANITLSDETADIYREPSVALVHRNSRPDQRRIISVGNDALLTSTDADALPVRPFKNGILFDSQLTAEIISHAISAVKTKDKIRCVVGVPSDFLPKQEKELLTMLNEAGVDTAVAVARPVAAIIGAGYSPSMSVISVNIGAQATEVAVMYKGEILYLERHAIGGEDFDRVVKQFILEQGDVNISLGVARTIKERLGAVWKGKPSESIDIEGTLSLTGNQLRMNLTTEDIVGVFEKPMQELIKAIVSGVKRIPPEAVEAVFDNGIILTGGGAELFGIETLLARVLGITVTKPAAAIDCVAKGLSRINGFLPTKGKYAGKNITAQVAKFYEDSKKK
ncbi:MAG: rod shape-determining protein [Clostridia bacterium]|nr:rod shape-determining protein [Clostridia bacterium]